MGLHTPTHLSGLQGKQPEPFGALAVWAMVFIADKPRALCQGLLVIAELWHESAQATWDKLVQLVVHSYQMVVASYPEDFDHFVLW